MEKGFNDDELADIMNEIESLEEEFSSDDHKMMEEPGIDEVAKSVAEMAEEEEDYIEAEEVFEEPVSVAPVEAEIFEELSEMNVEDIVPKKEMSSYDDNIHHMKVEESPVAKPAHSPKSGHTSMNFSVEGDMKLDLSFMIGTSEVKLHVTDEGLEIELEGGAKFSLPVNTPFSAKKVA